MPAKPEIIPEVYVVRADSGRWAEIFRRGGYVAISYGPVKNVPLYKALEVGKEFVREYPNQALILVMDNASYHHSAKVQALLSLLEHRVRIFWLPQYCPELNVIERFWLHLKQTVAANKLYSSIADLRHQVDRLLDKQNDHLSSDRLLFHRFFR